MKKTNWIEFFLIGLLITIFLIIMGTIAVNSSLENSYQSATVATKVKTDWQPMNKQLMANWKQATLVDSERYTGLTPKEYKKNGKIYTFKCDKKGVKAKRIVQFTLENDQFNLNTIQVETN